MFGAHIARKARKEGQENVSFVPETIEKHSFLQVFKKFNNRKLMMPEHHNDFVEDVPEGFDLLGHSDSCAVESMVKQDGRILCFQFHPEYLSDYAVSYSNRMKTAQPEFKISFNLTVPEEKKQEHLEACQAVRLCMQQYLA